MATKSEFRVLKNSASLLVLIAVGLSAQRVVSAIRPSSLARTTANCQFYMTMTSENSGPRNSFTFEWRIEKFDYWQEVAPRYHVLSPHFYALLDEGKWNLKLFPNGRNQGDPHLGLTLRSLTNTRTSIDVDIEWSILGSDGSTTLHVATAEKVFINGGCTIDLPHGPTSKQVFVTQKTRFIPSGNLTLRCRIWRAERDLLENEHVFGCTQVDVRKDSFKWCIQRFSEIPLKRPQGNLMGANFAPYAKRPVRTYLTLEGESLEDSTVRFEIFLKELECPLWIKINLLILDRDLKVVRSYVKNRIFKAIRKHATQIWTIQNLISRREILEKCLRDDVLTIRFKMYLIPQYSSFVERTLRGEESIESDTSRCLSATDATVQGDGGLGILPKHMDSVVRLSEDLRLAFENPTLSDFELRSGKSSFPAHKIVLSARSRVFRDLFSCKQANSKFMDVPDLDPKTLEMMLRFMYTGIVADSRIESAVKLYHAADKFQVPSLKRECWKTLRTDITPTNALEVLKLTDRLDDAELTSFARNFISDHFNDVIRTSEWEEFLVKHSYLAGKTVTEIYKRKMDEFLFLSDRCQ